MGAAEHALQSRRELEEVRSPRNFPAGLSLFSLASLRSTLSSAEPHSTPDAQPTTRISTSAPVDFVRFAYGDTLVVAGLRDGSVAAWRLAALVGGDVRPSFSSSPTQL